MRARAPLLLLSAIAFTACSHPPADATGTWKGTVTDPQGSAHPVTFRLKAVGGGLSGSVAVADEQGADHAIVQGSVQGNHMRFQVATGPADRRTLAFTGAIAGREMKGTVVAPEGPSMPFTVTKVSDSVVTTSPRRPGSEPPSPQGPDPRPEDAQAAVLAAFDHYDLVGGFSASHGNKDTDDFLLALIRNPRLPDKVNDIAVECGNALYQPILDRYIAGEDVPVERARQAWRNTSQPNCGVSAFYEELFPLVRRINQKLPPQKRLRVLACDPPIDWSRVHVRQDLEPTGDRDGSIAAVIEREVLARHRKALLLFGINHVRHGTAAARTYESAYPGRSFVIADHHGFGGASPLGRYNDLLEKRMASWPTPSLVTMKGTWLADLDCAYYDVDYLDSSDCHGYPGVDAYLYVGPRDLLLREPASARAILDTAYVSELYRRARVSGPQSPSDPDVIFARESQPSVFLEEGTGGEERMVRRRAQ